MARDLPEALVTLLRRLDDRGFVKVMDQTDEFAFGNRLIELWSDARREEGAVRLVRDRGLWDVEIELGGGWHGAYAVLLALRSAPYGTRAESDVERCETTLSVVDALARNDVPLAAIRRRLDEYRRAYWARLDADATE